MANLALGTVQFGMAYGVTNRAGRPDLGAVRDALAVARDHGVALLDTAHAYGEAEAALGETLQAVGYAPQIVTKTPALLSKDGGRIDAACVARARAAFEASLRLLRRDDLYGLMAHRGTDLLAAGGEELWRLFEALREAGRVRRIGASVYRPEEADALLARYPISLIQIPANLYDARFRNSGMTAKLAQAGVEIHVRSVFLQGVLLSEADALPPFMSGLRAHHAAYLRDARSRGLTPAAACLAPVLRADEVAQVVVGCQTADQLREVISAAHDAARASEEDRRALENDYVLSDTRILDPSEWPS